MKCPNCSTVLVMSERHGVEIDYCPNCRGVWLDKGELDKIIEKSAANETKITRPEVDRPDVRRSDRNDEYDSRQEYYDKDHPDYKRRKKRGFLGDFFDFD